MVPLVLTEFQGAIIGALAYIGLTQKLEFGKVIHSSPSTLYKQIYFPQIVVFAAFSQAVTYSVQAAAPPFPLFVAVQVFAGFGIALQASFISLSLF